MPTLTDLKIPVSKKSASWAISAAGLATALTTILVFWGTYGWITRAAYAEDEKKEATAEQMAVLISSLDNIDAKLDRNRDEWKCDEWAEELLDARLELAETDDQAEEIELDQHIEDLKIHRTERDCSRFTE